MRILILLFLISYQATGQTSAEEFLKNLKLFCGNRYSGKAVFPEGDKNPFKGEALTIHFSKCTDKEVRIPFQVGNDQSRTWVITLDDTGLLLKHDHRHADGTPDEITQYGGYAIKPGNSSQQSFPADEYTAKLIPAAATNEWTLIIQPDKKILSYILKRDGQLRFQADFDLSGVVNP
jgi:hypothetical protein